jgi:hypothetical protein
MQRESATRKHSEANYGHFARCGRAAFALAHPTNVIFIRLYLASQTIAWQFTADQVAQAVAEHSCGVPVYPLTSPAARYTARPHSPSGLVRHGRRYQMTLRKRN